MGTRARILLYAADPLRAEAAAQAAFARLSELDARLSDYRSDSEVAALARAAGGAPMPASHDLLVILQTAQEITRRSGGAFDATVGPLSRLWRRARRQNALPDADEIAAALPLVGALSFLRLDLERGTAALDRPGMSLDLGGIAKGYAADEALATLRQWGFARALVELGGEVVAGAPPPDAPGWTVALPGGPAPLVLSERAASTSGDAEQWLETGGVRYSHVVDPRTGAALQGRRSVTVTARRGLEADALATAASVLGPEEGLALVQSFPGAELRYVRESAEGAAVVESPGFVTPLR
jgi:thiamine biosynthesis lipoprotein